MTTQRRYGPAPATYTGICPRCRQRRKVRPASGTMVQHGNHRYRYDCEGWRDQPVPGTLEEVIP